MGTDPIQAKAELRRLVRAARTSRVPPIGEAQAFAAGALDCIGDASLPVATYLAMSNEPPTSAIIERLGAALVPRTTTRDAILEWVAYRPGDPLHRSRLGMDEPLGAAVGSGSAPLLACSAVVVPSLAIDARGRRLGQGGGYYDRVLADVPREIPIITLLFDEEILEDVHAETHDAQVDVCVTPTRTLRFSR